MSGRLGLDQLLALAGGLLEPCDEVLEVRRRERHGVRVAAAAAVGEALEEQVAVGLEMQQPPGAAVGLDQPLVGVAVAAPPQAVVQGDVVARLDQLDEATPELLDHRPFEVEVLGRGVVDTVAAVPGEDLLVDRQPNRAGGLELPGVGGLAGAGQPAEQVHDGWHAVMLSGAWLAGLTGGG